MSASDVILRKLVRQAETIRRLRLENWRLRQSRNNWKRRYAARSKQNTALRRIVRRLDERTGTLEAEREIKQLRYANLRARKSRDFWKRNCGHLRRETRRLEQRLNPPKRPCPPNIFLSEQDLRRILSMPPHCDR